MLEQDIELTKLLIEQWQNAAMEAAEVKSQLSEVEAKIAQYNEMGKSREGFADTLLVAAKALGREDLIVEMPGEPDLESQLEDLGAKSSTLVDRALELDELVMSLCEKAPDLVRDSGFPPESLVSITAEDGVLGSIAPDHEFSTADDEEADDKTDSEIEAEAVAIEIQLPQFNIRNITKRESDNLGRSGIFLIDGDSVLKRVPAYDSSLNNSDDDGMRDALINDLGTLAEKVPATYCLVLKGQFDDQGGHRDELTVASGDFDESDSDLHHRMVSMIEEFSGKLRTVCVISADQELLDTAKSKGMYTMKLSEFFNG